MQLCNYAIMQLCNYAIMQLCNYAIMQLCNYAIMIESVDPIRDPDSNRGCEILGEKSFKIRIPVNRLNNNRIHQLNML